MNILITICARGGSKGIPGKNIRNINGIPLLRYSINSALEFCKHYPSVIALSTDDKNIKEVAALCGLETDYWRPHYLATDTAGKTDVISDLLLFEEVRGKERFDIILDLDVTSPLRTFADLDEAFKSFSLNSEALNLFSVSHARRNPYFNMVEPGGDGFYKLVKEGSFLNRQSTPPVFELNASFYFYRRDFFEQKVRATINNKSMVYIMPHLCFDLDEPIDFDFMEYLLQNNKLEFEL